MRLVLLASLLLVAPALAGPGAGTIGPYAGVVDEGETHTHLYDNNPTNQNCIQIVRPYMVSVEATGPVQVSVAGHTIAGPVGSVTFEAGVCTSFVITVTSDSLAAYAIEVSYGVAPVVDLDSAICC